MMKPWAMRLMGLGAVKCRVLFMHLELEESFCLSPVFTERLVGRVERVYKSAISDHRTLFFSSLN